jgi:hypothetical protein
MHEAVVEQRKGAWLELPTGATVADLDSTALAVGRQRFAEKHPHLAGEVADWNVPTLLSKLKFSRGGQLTRAALLLFGKHESAQFLPLPAQVSWVPNLIAPERKGPGARWRLVSQK